MAVENLTATSRSELALADTKQVTARPGLNVFESVVAVSANASVASTYWMARIPSNARITNMSVLAFDDLASTGSPTIAVGLYAVGANITSDDDCLHSGIDVATAASTGTRIIEDPATVGLPAWDFVSGQTSDPGGFLDLKLKIEAAATNTGGDVALTLVYVLD